MDKSADRQAKLSAPKLVRVVFGTALSALILLTLCGLFLPNLFLSKSHASPIPNLQPPTTKLVDSRPAGTRSPRIPRHLAGIPPHLRRAAAYVPVLGRRLPGPKPGAEPAQRILPRRHPGCGAHCPHTILDIRARDCRVWTRRDGSSLASPRPIRSPKPRHLPPQLANGILPQRRNRP